MSPPSDCVVCGGKGCEFCPHVVGTTEYVEVKPLFNRQRVLAYARDSGTEHPWTHIGARLQVLEELREVIDWVEEGQERGDGLDELIRAIERRHRDASNTFLSFFQEGDAT